MRRMTDRSVPLTRVDAAARLRIQPSDVDCLVAGGFLTRLGPAERGLFASSDVARLLEEATAAQTDGRRHPLLGMQRAAFEAGTGQGRAAAGAAGDRPSASPRVCR